MNCGGGPCKDGLGSPVYAGEIFDPLNLAADGFTRFPFPNNTIPTSRDAILSPLKIQGFLPKPVNSLQALNLSAVRNYSPASETSFDQGGSQCIPESEAVGVLFVCRRVGSNQHGRLAREHHHGGLQHQRSSTARLNVDDSLRPSMLLHLGVGYVNTQVTKFEFPEVGNFDQKSQLGLTGAITPGFRRSSGSAISRRAEPPSAA